MDATYELAPAACHEFHRGEVHAKETSGTSVVLTDRQKDRQKDIALCPLAAGA